MAFFLENHCRVFGRDELLRRAWSPAIKAGHRTVDVPCADCGSISSRSDWTN